MIAPCLLEPQLPTVLNPKFSSVKTMPIRFFLPQWVFRNPPTPLTPSRALSPFLSSSFYSLHFSSTSTAVDPHAHVDEDEEEDADPLVYSASSSSSSPSVVNPTLLQPRVVVYDGVCHLCHGGVKWVIKADKYRKIKFCCLQSKTAEPYLRLCSLDRDDVRRRFLFVEGPGLYHQGSTAALKVASYLPMPYSALTAFMAVPAPLRDLVYDYVARRRYHWFGKAKDCLVLQEKEMLDRFIDREEIVSRDLSD